MVQWKGELEGDVGEKAHNLDELDDFNVPNFFVITPSEVEELFRDVKGKDQVLNSQVKGEVRNKIKEAYQDVGVSSEVRNAVGKAKSLVGGQRNNSLVSIRISNRESGEYEPELNVGSSNLFEAIKEVASSYYEKNDDNPAIIVQKMVEPEYSGAVITDYSENGLVEVVEGLGTALEKGSEVPHLYLIGREGIVEKRINGEQKRIERNPINGEKQRKNSGDYQLEDNEVKDFFGKVATREMNVKFAYNRGTFHVVDAWRADKRSEREINSLKGIKIGEGSTEGELGRDIKYTEKIISPEKYKALISEAGGFTSKNAQKARKYDKKAVVSYSGELETGSKIKINNRNIVEIEGKTKESDNYSTNFNESGSQKLHKFNQIAGSKVLALDPSGGDGLYTGSVFDKKMKLVENGGKTEISETNMVRTYEQAFGFNSDFLVLDVRDLELGSEVLSYLEADEKILILDQPELNLLEKAISEGFEKFAAPEETVEVLRKSLAKAEKRFILEKLREE